MNDAEIAISSALAGELRAAWHRYVDLLVPLRPALHAYCRRLTGDLWDAEDLAQETLVRAFARLGVVHPEVGDLRSYLLRTATNAWIDALRRRETEDRARDAHAADLPAPAAAGTPPVEILDEVRQAGARLLERLSPQEQAALVLKEVFDMPIVEVATLLATTTGAVKAALHRGRHRLRGAEPAAADERAGAAGPAERAEVVRARSPRAPSAALVDRFVALCAARDVRGLVALLVDGAVAENVGNSLHVGLDPEEGVPHFLHKVVHQHAEWPPEYMPDAVRLARIAIDGEPIVLSFATRRGVEALEVAFRLEEESGRIARIRAYGFCPETIRALGERIGERVRTGIYRAPTPAPGARWPAPAGERGPAR